MSKMTKTAKGLRTRLGFKVYILIAILIYTVVFSIAEITLYRSFRIFTWDLGVFNQALWNTLHGRFLYYTADIGIYTKTGSLLAAHFMPIILLALPPYAVCPTGETLLVISTLVVAIGALPAYEIANFFLKNEKTAAILGIFYLLYPPLQGVTLSGFSAESFAVTLFLFIVYYLIKPDLKKLALVVPLGLLTHEASVPVIAFIALYGMLYHRSVKNKGFQASLVILAICVPFFFFAQNMRIFFGWTGSPSLWHEWALMGATSTSDLPLKIFLNPVGAWNSFTFDGLTKLAYLVVLLLPVLFLPLLGLRGVIPATPFLFISLLSGYRLYYSLEGHYTAFVVPFIFLGLLHALRRLQGKPRFRISILKLTKLILLACMISLIVLLPLIYSQYQVFNVAGEHDNIIRSFILRIPQNASVLTQSNIFPHVSDRPDAYTIAPPIWSPEYERIDKEILQNLSKLNVKYVLLDFSSESSFVTTANLIYIGFIIPNWNEYGLVGAKDGVVLFCLKT